MIDRNTVAAPAASLVARKVGDETIIVNEHGDTLHTLNETGSFIWEHMDGVRALKDIIALLSEEYELPHEGVEAEICGFVEQLAAGGIVSLRPLR